MQFWLQYTGWGATVTPIIFKISFLFIVYCNRFATPARLGSGTRDCSHHIQREKKCIFELEIFGLDKNTPVFDSVTIKRSGGVHF